MLFSFVTLLTIVLLIVGLPSVDGKHSDNQNNQEVQQGMNFKKALLTEGQFNEKVEERQGMKFESYFQTNVRRSKEMKNEQRSQKTLLETKGIKLRHQLKNKERRQVLHEKELDQEIFFGHKFLINMDERMNMKLMEQLQTNAPKRPLKNMHGQIRLTINTNQRAHFQNTVPLLWKRGQKESANIPKSEKDIVKDKRNKLKHHHQDSETTSKIKDILHPISDAFSKAKQKIKPLHSIIGPFSKTRRSMNRRTRKSNSIKSDTGEELTSEYTERPSVLGRPPTEYPVEGFSIPYYEVSPPLKPIQSTEHHSSGPLSMPSFGTQCAKSREEAPLSSPMKSPEVKEIWNFIDRVSKKWQTSKETSHAEEEPIRSGRIQTTKFSGSPSHERTNQRDESSPTRRSPMDTQSQHSVIKSPDAKLSDSESETNKIITNFITCRKEGWAMPENYSATHENTQSPSGRPPYSRDSQSPTRSPPQSPVKSPPQSPIKGAPQSPTKPTSPIQSSDLPQPPEITLFNSKKHLRQLNNEEINDKYNNFANKVRSQNQPEKPEN